MRIFQGMFAAVLKDRFRLSASALGTNPFFGFLCICHNQAFELMFAVRAFDDIDRHQLTLFFTVCLPMTFKELIFIEHSGFNRPGNPSKINHMPGIDIFRGYIFPPGSATQT